MLRRMLRFIFFNIHKSPRHIARGVCMYGASSSPAQAGGVCMYVLTSPERVEVGLRHRRREPQSRLRHDGRRRGSPAPRPRAAMLRLSTCGRALIFWTVFAGGLFLLSSRPGPVGV